MSKDNSALKRPPAKVFLKESRVVLDVLKMTPLLASVSLHHPQKNTDRLIIVVPGFGFSDLPMAPLRFFLQKSGYMAEGWGLGINRGGLNLPHTQDDLSERWDFSHRENYKGEAGVPYLSDKLYERVLRRNEGTGRRVTLIGWSLGGYLAREVARDLPDVVDQVITLGSPIIGGPKYTAAASAFSRRGLDLDWIEAEIRNRESRPIQQPITAIISKSDAIVSWSAAIDHYSENVDHIEVDAAHLGMGFNPEVWQHVLTALKKFG